MLDKTESFQDPSPETETPCCLLIEDNRSFRYILSTFLNKHGIGADEADNGKEGVALYLRAPQKYHTVFLDLQMPVMDGRETLRAIRASGAPNAQSIPVVAITGDSADHGDSEFSFTTILKKPFDLTALLSVVQGRK